MENGYGQGVFNGEDADNDEAFLKELKTSRTGQAEWLRQATNKGAGRSHRHPIYLGSMDELEISMGAIRAVF